MVCILDAHGRLHEARPVVGTMKTCCDSADSTERAFLGTLPAFAAWQMQDTVLTLVGGGVAVKLRTGQH